jgi:hypothetical protein
VGMDGVPDDDWREQAVQAEKRRKLEEAKVAAGVSPMPRPAPPPAAHDGNARASSASNAAIPHAAAADACARTTAAATPSRRPAYDAAFNDPPGHASRYAAASALWRDAGSCHGTASGQ